MSDHRRFGDQYGLINAMRQHRWSYTALAREIGVSRQQLYNCARGVITPSPKLRTNLANFFNVSPGELFSRAALAAKDNEGMAQGGKNRWRRASAA